MVTTLTKKIGRDLIKLKGQVITIALVVCSGISVLISSLSTYQSLQHAQQKFYSEYHFADVFASLKQAPKALAKQLSQIPGVSQVEVRIVKDVILDLSWLSEPVIGRFISLPDKNIPHLNQLNLRQGRWLDPERINEVLVNESFAEAHQIKPGATITALLNGHREVLKIAGIVLSPEYVYAIRGEDLLPDNKHFGIFWMNEKALSAAFGMQESFNDISLTLTSGASDKPVRSALERLLLRYGLSMSYTRDNQISDRFVSNEIKQQRVIASFIPPIFLMVAAFLLNLVTGRLVNKQREQIATLKAVGYSNTSIAIYYTKMIAIIVLLGATAGIILGAWFGKLMTLLYTEYFRFPFFSYYFSLSAAIIGILVSLIAAGSGAMRAIYQVVNLAPAVAMRPPAPPIYRTLQIEKYSLLANLSASTKMFYRYIFRHLIRSITTSLGIALAMAIVILGLFWQDAVRHMINIQFFMSQHEDAQISFTTPLNKIALVNLKKITGVINSEGYRVVPARLSYQHRTEQTALFGLPKQAQLKVILDKNLRAITIPPHALVLSEGLADRLHAKVGDRLQLNILEGNRAEVLLNVQEIVNDYVGMFAYADINLVNRLLAEDNLVNIASITIDNKYITNVYSEIKNIPKIGTITFKTSIIKTFQETFAKHILVFTSILAGFAIVIALSVVYNNAKITLAERSWELATLRVLGFTEREVSNMLFFNITFETLLAIPFGLLFGYALAWMILQLMQTDWFKIPFIIAPQTYVIAILTVLFSSVMSFFLIQRQIKRFDLSAVLKVAD